MLCGVNYLYNGVQLTVPLIATVQPVRNCARPKVYIVLATGVKVSIIFVPEAAVLSYTVIVGAVTPQKQRRVAFQECHYRF